MSQLIVRAFTIACALNVAAPAFADEDLAFEELPEPVQLTARREIKGGTITEIESDVEGGQTVYEVEFVLDGAEYELDIAPDGTLLRRHRD
jgi:hypothetical protein